jgi:hypothetical protein
MEKISIVFSILTHDGGFMMWFWFFVTLPVGIWHIFYFPSKSHVSEKALTELSPEFKNINSEYLVFSVVAVSLLMLFPLLALAPSLDKWSMMEYGIRFYPSILSFTAGYGIYQGLFALIKGAYPMAKSLYYVCDDKAKIRRVANLQILISVSAVVVVVLFFFATV